MKRNARRQRGKASLEMFEEAFHLVRSAPSVALASYYLGTLPFVLGLLWFWTDMSRSPFAYEHLDAAALGMASLFAWMILISTPSLRAAFSAAAACSCW